MPCHFGVTLVQIPTKWHGISVKIWCHVTWIPPFNIFNIFWWNHGRNSMETHRNPMESRCHIGMNLDQKDTKIWHHMTPLSGRTWWHIFSRVNSNYWGCKTMGIMSWFVCKRYFIITSWYSQLVYSETTWKFIFCRFSYALHGNTYCAVLPCIFKNIRYFFQKIAKNQNHNRS